MADGYRKLAPLVRDHAFAYRYVQFKIAQVLAFQAEDDKALQADAVKARR